MGRAVSLLREFGIAAAPARHPIAVPREEHARAALGAVRPLPRDPIPVNLVELSLQSGRAFLLLRFGHHFASFFLPSGFLSAFFSSFFSSFFSAGFFSSLAQGFFSSFGGGLSGFASALASAFGASAFGAGAAGFFAFSALGGGVGFSRFRPAPFFCSRAVILFRGGVWVGST